MTLPRRLPVTTRPAQHETLSSYLRRLAALNSLDGDDLWERVTVPVPRSRRRTPAPAALAALSGHPAASLQAAVPDLRDPPPDWHSLRHAPQAGCRRCDAGHPGGQPFRLFPHHAYACIPHRYWIGPPDLNHPGPSLRALPEVITAQRHHQRLVRRHGWAAAYDAVLTGIMICAHLWEDPETPAGSREAWERRLQVLIPPGQVAEQFSASRLFAAVYPEAVSLATVIASPRWRAMATGTSDQLRLLAAEIGRRIGNPGYRPRNEQDAIGHWIAEDASQPPSEPTATFATTRSSHRPSQLAAVSAQSQARHDNSAMWFRTRPRPGSVILHHRAIMPVVIRPWSPDMDRYAGAIWMSQRTEARKYEELNRTIHPPPVRRKSSRNWSTAPSTEALPRTRHSGTEKLDAWRRGSCSCTVTRADGTICVADQLATKVDPTDRGQAYGYRHQRQPGHVLA